MSNIDVVITFKTNRRSSWAGAYAVEMQPTEASVTNILQQRGPIFNNQLLYRGVFSSSRNAARAILDFVGAPCKLVEFRSPASRFVRILASGERPKCDEFTRTKVLASRNAAGIFEAV